MHSKIICLRKPILFVALLVVSCGCLAQSAEELRVQTRFGVLSLDNKDRLLFKDRLIEPVMRANSGMDAGKPFHVGNSDVCWSPSSAAQPVLSSTIS